MTKLSEKRRRKIIDDQKEYEKYVEEYDREINVLLNKYGMAADGCLGCHELTLGLAKAIVSLSED